MDENIYSPPKADLTIDNADSSAPELASKWSRFLAFLIDILTILPVSITVVYFTGGIDNILDGVQPSLSNSVMMVLLSTAVFLLIHGRILLRDGQTWGKKALGIKIVTMKSDHADLQVLAKRYGFYWGAPYIPFIGQIINVLNILFIFSKSRRCLHDRVAGTQVIKMQS